MATANDIFNSIETEEPHIVINNDRSITVPDVLKNVAVQYDHDIETVTFDCPRYWDGNDLSGMKIMINFIKPLGDQGTYVCKPATIDQSNDKIIHFDWTISSEVTAQPGDIKFIVCMQKDATDQTTSLIWHSQICSLMTILPGIECDTSVMSDYDAGKFAAWSEFWDIYQANGSKKVYDATFKSASWNDKIFRPKYDICPTQLEQTFQYTGITNLISALEKQNVKFDTSNCTFFLQTFQGSRITHYPTIDMSKATNTTYAFGSDANVTKIEKLILSKSTPFYNTFQLARKLEEITIEGIIGQNGFNVQWSNKLTHDSLLSILNALEDKTSDNSGTTWTIGLGPTNIAKLTANEKSDCYTERMDHCIMPEYTYITDTEHVYPNLTIKKVLHDGALTFYDLRANDGYVMYRTDANDMEMDEYGEWHPVIYYCTNAILPPRINFDTQFTWFAVPRSTVDENMIFGIGDKHETM